MIMKERGGKMLPRGVLGFVSIFVFILMMCVYV